MKNSLRFILVDDDPFALALTEKLIQGFSEYAEIISFNCANKALKFVAKECNLMKNISYTVILTDLHMPETDGLGLLDGIEKLDTLILGRLDAFVLSAAANPTEIEQVLSRKCVKGFVSKPLSIEKMNQIINSIQYPDGPPYPIR